MLLNHLSAQCNRAGRDNRAHGVVGYAGDAVVGPGKRRDDAQIHVLVRGRVGRHALKQNDVLVALSLAGVEGERDVLRIGNSGRENHRLVKRRNLADHGDVVDFVGCDLVGRHVKLT